jgi:hypothetical protein
MLQVSCCQCQTLNMIPEILNAKHLVWQASAPSVTLLQTNKPEIKTAEPCSFKSCTLFIQSIGFIQPLNYITQEKN